ncbi:MAG: GlsB/YeaQ/YmgE family stress response membrane protein [Acidimicrobiales bacterium]
MAYVFWVAIVGLFVGALGRLIVPGRQKMGCLATMAAGIAGSIVGGIVGRTLFGSNYAPGLIMSTLTAAALIYVFFRFTDR